MNPESAPGAERSLIFGHEALGRSQPWVLHHRGLEYTGEVIVAEAVDPAWTLPLGQGLDFRIVLLTVPRRIRRGLIQDPRIAMAVPLRPPTQVDHLGAEIRSIREARARYVTARDQEWQGLRGAIGERESSLREEVARRYAASYAQGRIYTHADLRLGPRDIFEATSPGAWADRMASAVLLSAYPTLPLDHTAFPDHLTSDRIADVYQGLFQDGGRAEAARDFGPGLGLSSPESPGDFDASSCEAVEVIRTHLDSRGGDVPFQEALRVLTFAYGLTRPLAALYVMAFVRQAHGELELGSGHSVEARAGGPFVGDRVTWDLVPEVRFSRSLTELQGVLRLRPSPEWNTVLPYATLLVEGLQPATGPTEVTAQERRLLDYLASMARQIDEGSRALEEIQVRLDVGLADAKETLEKLRAIASASAYAGFYSLCQETFGGPAALSDALAVRERVDRLAAMAPAIAQVRQYLDGMAFGRAHQEISFEREALVARMDGETLLANPRLWDSVETAFRHLRSAYRDAYTSHHVLYHQEALELTHRLERVGPQVEAVARFNEIPELGDPVGTDLQQRFRRLADSFAVCPVTEDGLSVEDAPRCPACALGLDQETPGREAEEAFGSLERAMREYNRRLSSHGVRQILAHPSREQLDKFISLVQVADPSALANVLDDEVVQFLRQFLRGR